MADFAPNYTARYRLHYTVTGKSHTMTWRVASSVTDPTGVASKMELFLADLQEDLYSDFTCVSADFALADTDIFLPAPVPASPAGTASPGDAKETDKALSLGFVGRSAAGGKARFFLYGTIFGNIIRSAPANDWKVVTAEDPAGVGAGIVRLNETSPALVANDDHIVTWYEYANLKYNDRWVRRQRRG
jgi:hypothetical protein